MKPQPDSQLLLRAAGRCMALARDLDDVHISLSRASRHAATHWTGAGADAFAETARAQRDTVSATRDLVARLGVLSRDFAHQLSDEQDRARRAVDPAAEARIAVLHRRFGRQLLQLEGDLSALLPGAPAPRLSHQGPPRIPRVFPIAPSLPRQGPPRPPWPRPPGLPMIRPPRWTGPPLVAGPTGHLHPDGCISWGTPWRQS